MVESAAMSGKGQKSSPARPPTRITNRRATFDYEILEKFEVGIALQGSEVKSLRAGKASIDEAWAHIADGQLRLRDMYINPYPQAGYAQHEPTRERTLLAHRREIKKLGAKVTQRGWTLIPLSLYFNDRGLVKLQIALVRGKTHGDKRSDIKEREHKREIERAMKRR